MKPKPGDRVVIKGIPDNALAQYYEGTGVIQAGLNGETICYEEVSFCTGNVPPFKNDSFVIRGTSHKVKLKNLKFVKTAEAPFLKYLDGIRPANILQYNETVNWYEVNFKDVDAL